MRKNLRYVRFKLVEMYCLYNSFDIRILCIRSLPSKLNALLLDFSISKSGQTGWRCRNFANVKMTSTRMPSWSIMRVRCFKALGSSLSNFFYLVNKTFQKTKAESKQILERSRHDLAAASEEIQKEYAIIEEVRLVYEKNLELAREQGLPEPDASGVDFRTVDELQAELETQRANLDMNLNTNPGVIEEYEKRKRDVRAFLVMIVLAPGY